MLIEHLPPQSALHVSMNGPQAAWSTTDYLLAGVLDLLAGANWQRGGGKGQRPKPVPRPGERANETRWGSGSYSLEEMRQILHHWHGGD